MNLVEQSIQSRKTSKVMLAIEHRHEQVALWTAEHDAALQSMLETAAWAPFHKRAHELHCKDVLNSPVPWRFHIAGPDACTRLLSFLEAQSIAFPDSKWSRAWQSKIKELICACGVLVQATWLPEPDSEESSGSELAFSHKNIEHVAAASSAVQNLLLAAQSHEWLNYWSSGGILRDDELFDYLGISREEKLLGSIFLTPKAHPSARILDGGLREQRGDVSTWVAWI